MLKTKYTRLATAAEMLGTDVDTLLIAAAELRVDLVGLLNQEVECVWRNRYSKKADCAVPDSSPQPYFVRFVPLGYGAGADLLKTGMTGDVWRIETLPDGSFLEVNADFETWVSPFRIEMKDVFIEWEEIDSILEEGELPAPRHSTEISDHVSDELAKLNLAARVFWANADKNAPETHPENKKVAVWLKERGFSQALSEKGASIIRPRWAHKGRKPTV